MPTLQGSFSRLSTALTFIGESSGPMSMLERADADPLRAMLQEALGSAYGLERELPGAGMSRVFIADQPALGRKVVLKVVGYQLLSKSSARRFRDEIRLSAALQQANIIPVLDAGTAAGLPYYTMPLVEEQSLRERLAREGALSIRDSMNILRDVARALAYAHAHGVVHRDIKPGNVLLSGGSAIVTDFGIARALGAALGQETTEQITAGTCSGTPSYMAPEQMMGDVNADHRVDLYSFGCLAYDVFTGRPPFGEQPLPRIVAAQLQEIPRPLSALRPDVPSRIVALVARCLEKAPAKRPQSASELLDELDAASEEDCARTPRTRQTIVISLCGVAILALFALAVRPQLPARGLAVGVVTTAASAVVPPLPASARDSSRAILRGP